MCRTLEVLNENIQHFSVRNVFYHWQISVSRLFLPLSFYLIQKTWVLPTLLPPATKLGQGYVFTGVCHSVNRGGEVPDQVHPPGQGTPPGLGAPPRHQVHPRDQVHPPRTRYTPRDQVHPPRPGTPPGLGTPPGTEHAGRYGQRAGGTHPTGMQSCYHCVNSLIIQCYQLASYKNKQFYTVSQDCITHNLHN